GNIRLGIAGPRHPKLSQSARDGFSSRPIVGERVIVEEVLLDLGKVSAGHADLFDDVLDRPGPIPVTADRLGPEAKRAFRAAAASRIERYVRMQEVADEVVLDGQVPLVHVDDERQLVHPFENGTIGSVPGGLTIEKAQSEGLAKRPALGDLL